MENGYIPVKYEYDIICLNKDRINCKETENNSNKRYEINISIVKSSKYYYIKISSLYYSIIDEVYKLYGCYCIHSRNDIEDNIFRSICSEILYQHLSKLSYLIFEDYQLQLKVPPHVICYKSILIPPIQYIWDYLYRLEDNQDCGEDVFFVINL